MTRKTLLFTPGDRPERFSKAAESGADALIIDLEDAVAPDRKEAARANAVEWLADQPGLVRVNGRNTSFHGADLALVRVTPHLSGIVVPKCESEDDVRSVREQAPDVPIIALVETAGGVERVAEIARAEGVTRLAFGNVDFALDARIRPTGSQGEHELSFARSAIIIASRAADLPSPLDGVHTDIADAAALARSSARSRALGFGGRLCIHPSQVTIANAAYAPTQDEIAWARRVLAAAHEHDDAAFQFEGRMIDRPVIELARSYAEHEGP